MDVNILIMRTTLRSFYKLFFTLGVCSERVRLLIHKAGIMFTFWKRVLKGKYQLCSLDKK